jgi:hypothetical protein
MNFIKINNNIIQYGEYIQQYGTNIDKNHFHNIKQVLNPIDKLLEPNTFIDNMCASYHYIIPKFMALIELQIKSCHTINELLTLNMILRIFNANNKYFTNYNLILDMILLKTNDFIPKLNTILSQDHDIIIIELCYDTLQQCNIARDICYSSKNIA